MAEKLEALEAEALTLRSLIGGSFGFVAQLKVPLGERLERIVATNDAVNAATGAHPFWRKPQIVNRGWTAFAAALATNPAAKLTFN